MFEKISSTKKGKARATLETTIQLAVEMAREGREGRKVGTIFIIGDKREVLKRSRSVILDPLKGHPDKVKKIDSPNMRETLKELSQIDGAFLISQTGIAVSGGLYINASASDLDIPLGLGGRHIAAAYITKVTNSTAVTVSESSVVRVFDHGHIIAEIIPETWMSRASIHVKEPYIEEHKADLIIITKK